MRRGLLPLALAAGAFAGAQWLRWSEPPGLDQSLFVFYGTWLRRGLVLYRDLWDSKPPGLFAAYGIVEPLAGVAHTPRVLDALAAVFTAALVFRILRRQGGEATSSDEVADMGAWVGAILAAFVASAPIFGGPRVAAQPEVLMAPLVLGAVLVSRRAGGRAALLAGALLGAAACLKLVAVVLLPLAWVFVPAGAWRRPGRAALVLAGWAIPILGFAAWLALHGALGEAVRAVLVFPRTYEDVIANRMALLPALARGATGLGRGIPLVVVLAAVGALVPPRRPLAHPAVVWLVLAAAGAAAQRQIVDYQVFLCTTPLVLLAGCGAGRVAGGVATLLGGDRRARARDAAALVALLVAVAVPAAVDLRAWRLHYAPHVAYRTGRIDRPSFLLRLGRPGLLWLEAEKLVESLRTAPPGPTTEHEALLVWGLAPAVYALADCEPVTRYAFHQTLLVAGAPLAERWPGVESRREELLERLHRAPPRYVVVVHGDRSGLEPQDSAAELQDFPELARILATEYAQRTTTRSYELWLRGEPRP